MLVNSEESGDDGGLNGTSVDEGELSGADSEVMIGVENSRGELEVNSMKGRSLRSSGEN